MKHLYIIGNGFDKHHEINSGYDDFVKWIEENDASLLTDMTEIYGFCDKSWWSKFEDNLASLDTIEFACRIAFENQPDLLSEHCDRTWEDAKFAVELILNDVYIRLRENFHHWITHLNAPVESKKININTEDSVFLSFNYTKTLENIYNIPHERVLHIHGCVDNDEDFILGHGKSYEDLAQNNEEQYKINNQFHEKLAEDAAIAAVASQQKPVQDIISMYNEFFLSLKEVELIHIYGFSFSITDIPYLQKIISVVNMEKVRWEISDFRGKSKDAIIRFVCDNKIENYDIICLSFLLCFKQLVLDV